MFDTEKGTQHSHTQCPPAAHYEVRPVFGAIHSDVPSPCLPPQMSPSDTTNRQGHRIDTKACLTVFGAFLAMFCTFGQMNSFGTYQTWYKAHQLHDRTPSEISWVGSLQLWVFFLSGGPIGHLFDKFGPTVLLTTGTIIYTFAIMMTSISTQYYQYILSQGILFGLGVGLIFYPSLASVSTHFSKYRATAIGIVVTGSSIGGVVYPVMLQHLFGSLGFGWAVRISGLISMMCCVAATLMITSITSANAKVNPSPITIKTFTDLRYLFLAIGSSLVALGLFIPYFYIVEYAQHLSIAPQMSFYILAVMNGGGFFGRIAPAYLSDIIGRFNILMPSAFFSGVGCLLFWMLSKSLAVVIIFAVTYGFFSGAFISVVTPCVAQISDIRQIGTQIGMLYTIISFPSLVGGPVAGALLVRNHGVYGGMIAFSGVTLIAGSIFILVSKLNIDPRIFARV